jgi:hypothetical protein
MFEILIFLVFIGVMVFLLTWQKKELMELYRQQATKRNGRVKTFLFLFPKLILFDQGREIQVHQDRGGQNSPTITHMTCTLTSPKDYKITVGPENALVKIGKSFGMKDIQTGHSEFDASFLVRGSDEGTVRAFLGPEIQESLLHLEERFPKIKIEDKKFHFNISGQVKKEKQLDQFIEAGLMMIKKVNEMG